MMGVRMAGKPAGWLRATPQGCWAGAGGAAHLPPVHAALTARVRQLPAHIEEHVVLSRCPLLHEVCREHPRPEDDAVVLEAPCRRRPERLRRGRPSPVSPHFSALPTPPTHTSAWKSAGALEPPAPALPPPPQPGDRGSGTLPRRPDASTKQSPRAPAPGPHSPGDSAWMNQQLWREREALTRAASPMSGLRGELEPPSASPPHPHRGSHGEPDLKEQPCFRHKAGKASAPPSPLHTAEPSSMTDLFLGGLCLSS